MSSIKVHYFPGYGRAEAIRMLLAHANVPFENVNYTFAELPAAKESGNLEFGQLPVVEIDGKFHSQSGAILRLVGSKYGYYPQDALTAYRIDSILDFINDLLNSFYKAAFAPTEEEKKTLMETFYEGAFTKWVSIIDKKVADNSSQSFIVGDSLTIADFGLASVAYGTFYNEANPNKEVQAAIVAKFPTAEKYFKGLGETLKEYLATRPACPW